MLGLVADRCCSFREGELVHLELIVGLQHCQLLEIALVGDRVLVDRGFTVASPDVVVLAVEDGVLGGVKVAVHVDLVVEKSAALDLLWTHSFVDVHSQSSE